MQNTTLLLLAALAPLPQDTRDLDAAPAALAARAERPAEPAAPRADLGPVGSGNRLFWMTGADNAACVRGTADVTGDGIDEVLVGIDESQTENVFCLNGTSAGAATVVWSLETMSGVSGGSPYGDQCIVPVDDTEGNGAPNVLLGTAWGGRSGFDLDTLAGAEISRYDTYLTPDSGWVYSLCRIGDVNGDGTAEYALGAGSDNDTVVLLDGASAGPQATAYWTYAAGDAVYSVRNLGDTDGDGYDEILAAIGDNVDRLVCLKSRTLQPGGEVLWTYTPGVSVFAGGVLSDVTGDGIKEALAVCWTLNGSAIRCVDGTDGSLVWASTNVADYAQMVDELEDVNGDGVNDVVVSSWENAVQVLSGADGSRIWKTSVGNLNGGDVWTARAIDDLNGDGRQDVIAGSFDYHVYALDGDDGKVFWAYDTGNRVFSVAPVGDLNGDGRPEVAVGTQDTTSNVVVHVLEGDADIPYPGLELSGRGAIGGPIGVEVTGDAGSIALVAYSTATGSMSFSGLGGTLGLALPVVFLPRGPIPAGGTFNINSTIPNDPSLDGLTIYLQALVYTSPPLAGDFTDVEALTFKLGG